MKKAFAAVVLVALLGTASVASAFMWGGFGGYGGHMMGTGPMMGQYYGEEAYGEKYLDETAGLRREFNAKGFEYGEAFRTGDMEKVDRLARELDAIAGKIGEKAPRGAYYSGRYDCPGPYGR